MKPINVHRAWMPLTVHRSCFYRAFIELSACLYQSLERAFIEKIVLWSNLRSYLCRSCVDPRIEVKSVRSCSLLVFLILLCGVMYSQYSFNAFRENNGTSLGREWATIFQETDQLVKDVSLDQTNWELTLAKMEFQFQIYLQLTLRAKKMHQQIIRWKIATLG